MILMIDNYDSFTYNIYQYLSELTKEEIKVVRNDAITIEEAKKLPLTRIIISPGPGRPEDAGVSMEMIKAFAGKLPILGVCLGHQCIAQAFGGKIVNSSRICHGKTDQIESDQQGLYRNIPKQAIFTRYHSLIAEEQSLPPELEISARSNSDGEIMGIRHREFDIEGVQFHPESIASEHGKQLLSNFLNYRKKGHDVKELLNRVMNKIDLTAEEIGGFMEELTEGSLNDIVIAGMLTALNAKGITAEEITGCANVLLEKRTLFNCDKKTTDTCGTGGDGKGSFNISSMAALIVAACGQPVAKHGNRAISSKSGSADFYEKLGIPIEVSPSECENLLKETGFAFLYAPLYHSALRFAAPARKALGVKTILNLLGPLVNPARADYQIIGIFSEKFLKPVALAAKALGVKRVITVHSMDGMDEISVSAPTKMVRIFEDGELHEEIFNPIEEGYQLYDESQLAGGSASENVELAKSMLKGEGSEALTLSVTLNAGAALYLSGVATSIKDGEKIAREALENGEVNQLIEKIKEWDFRRNK